MANWPPSDDPAGAVNPPAVARSGRSRWARSDPVVCTWCGLKFSPRAYGLHLVAPYTFAGQAGAVCCPEVELARIGLFCFDPAGSPRWYGVNPQSSLAAWERLLRDLAGGSATMYQIACCRPVWGRPETLADVLRLVAEWSADDDASPGVSPGYL